MTREEVWNEIKDKSIEFTIDKIASLENELIGRKKLCELRYQQIKTMHDRWEKLKQFIELEKQKDLNRSDKTHCAYAMAETHILAKMIELEKGD